MENGEYVYLFTVHSYHIAREYIYWAGVVGAYLQKCFGRHYKFPTLSIFATTKKMGGGAKPPTDLTPMCLTTNHWRSYIRYVDIIQLENYIKKEKTRNEMCTKSYVNV